MIILTTAQIRRLCQCGTKRTFRSPEAAEHARKEIRQRGGDRLISYRCGVCRKWHLGHAQLGDGKVKRVKLARKRARVAAKR